MNLKEIERSVARLNSLGFFEPGIRPEFLPTGEPGLEDLVIPVTERETSNLNFMVGVSSDSGLLGGISIIQRNFDVTRLPTSPTRMIDEYLDRRAFAGGGQELTLDLFPGSEFSTYRLRFFEPYLLGVPPRPISLDADLYKRFRVFDDFDEDRIGTTFTVGKNFTRETSMTLGYRMESVDLSDVDAGAPSQITNWEDTNHLRGIRTELRYRDVDRFLFPTRGVRGRLGYEVVGGPLAGSVDIQQVNAYAIVYRTLFTTSKGTRFIGTLSGTFDWAWAFRDTPEVPIFERFFAGGSSTLRGFEFRGIGPRVNAFSVGGEARILGSGEITFPIVSTENPETGVVQDEWLRGAFFLDAGSLAEDIGDEEMGRIRVSTGFGIRLLVPPLGPFPFAFDFGWPLRREPGDETQLVSFSFSRSF
jgi:outer membrane protein insertion porin family